MDLRDPSQRSHLCERLQRLQNLLLIEGIMKLHDLRKGGLRAFATIPRGGQGGTIHEWVVEALDPPFAKVAMPAQPPTFMEGWNYMPAMGPHGPMTDHGRRFSQFFFSFFRIFINIKV